MYRGASTLKHRLTVALILIGIMAFAGLMILSVALRPAYAGTSSGGGYSGGGSRSYGGSTTYSRPVYNSNINSNSAPRITTPTQPLAGNPGKANPYVVPMPKAQGAPPKIYETRVNGVTYRYTPDRMPVIVSRYQGRQVMLSNGPRFVPVPYRPPYYNGYSDYWIYGYYPYGYGYGFYHPLFPFWYLGWYTYPSYQYQWQDTQPSPVRTSCPPDYLGNIPSPCPSPMDH